MGSCGILLLGISRLSRGLVAKIASSDEDCSKAAMVASFLGSSAICP